MTLQSKMAARQQFFLRNILDYVNILMIINTNKLKSNENENETYSYRILYTENPFHCQY